MSRGFTIKEMAMVLIVIGILCFAAIPAYHAMQDSQRQTQAESLVLLLQHGLRNIESPEPLAALDSQADNSACTDCFSAVLTPSINNPLLFKANAREYYFSQNGNTGSLEAYQESGDYKLEYNAEEKNVILSVIP